VNRVLLIGFVLSIPLSPTRSDAASHGQCAAATVTSVAGTADTYRIQTPHGSIIARRQAAPTVAPATAAIAEFRVFPGSFDADGDTLGTVHDTILVAPGTIVRWVRRGLGFHTITNGADSGDPLATLEYSDIFDDAVTSVEHVFTTEGRHDFFCFIHEPTMEGSIIVTSATAGVSPGVIRTPRFSRPPAPNPSRGDLGFAIALPRSTHVTLAVHDVTGRRLASLQDGPLPAGEHAFRWNGRGSDGRLLQSGRYFIRFAAGGVRESRPVSLIR
jgi:plastocyanin